MDDAMRAHFREKGWLVVKDALSADVIAAANRIFDTFLDGTAERMHPEDSAWDGEEFTHYWYNTGQVRPARRDASLSLPLGSFSTKERCVGAGALLGWMHNRGCGAPVVFGSSATAVRRSSNVTWSTTGHGEVCIDRVRPK